MEMSNKKCTRICVYTDCELDKQHTTQPEPVVVHEFSRTESIFCVSFNLQMPSRNGIQFFIPYHQRMGAKDEWILWKCLVRPTDEVVE